MTTLFDELIKEGAEDFQKLENSEEYKYFVSRKNDLQKKKDTIVDEIYENRTFHDKIEVLTKAKIEIENAIKDVDNKLKAMQSQVSGAMSLNFLVKSLKNDPIEEFLNPKSKTQKKTKEGE